MRHFVYLSILILFAKLMFHPGEINDSDLHCTTETGDILFKLRPFASSWPFFLKFNSDIVPFFFETKVVVMKAVDGICYLGILKYKFSLVKPEEKIIPKNLLLNRIDSHPKYQPQPYTTHLLIHSLHQTFD